MYLKISVFLLICIDQLLTEKCVTPNNEEAECISLYSCPVLIGALATQQDAAKEYVSKSNCGGTASNPKVCCGSFPFYTTPKINSSQSNTETSFKKDLLADRRYCGYQHSDDYFRSATGTSLDEFPWLALLIFKNTETGALNPDFRCSGSLISNRYVLTAAHCTWHFDHDLVAVRLGDHNVEKQEDCVKNSEDTETECSAPVEEIAIESVVRHSLYKRSTSANDIALLRLNRTVTYSDYIRPICLPESENVSKIDDTLTTSGWGKNSVSGDYSKIKKRISTKLISNEECREEFKHSRKAITENNLCTKEVAGNAEFSCQGDSGGPLMFSIRNQWQQEGILSFGKSCAGVSPEVHTKVVNYVDWIGENVKP